MSLYRIYRDQLLRDISKLKNFIIHCVLLNDNCLTFKPFVYLQITIINFQFLQSIKYINFHESKLMIPHSAECNEYQSTESVKVEIEPTIFDVIMPDLKMRRRASFIANYGCTTFTFYFLSFRELDMISNLISSNC